MTPEYVFHYVCFAVPITEGFDTLDEALTRSSEVLTRNLGSPKSISRKGAVVYDQEALFNDWLQSLQG